MPFPRHDAPELLDLNVGTLADAGESLGDLRRINRWLGGTAVVLRHLTPRLARAARHTQRPLVIADIGAGSADIPVALVHWARRVGVAVRVLAVDLNQRHLALARPTLTDYPEIQLVAAEGGNLPLTARVDYVVASLFLHHFPPAQVRYLLRTWYELAECGVIANDLIRARLPYAGYFLLQPFIARSYLTRYDAPLSIRRAYTLAEMRRLAEQADVPARLYWHWPWRMAVVADKVKPGE
ncbi:MAG: methyltransferase domain-containing protein [Anaerolineae bacterium]|nr:methyltransferase domain-containing protein [Anaerolineae bacterium]